MSIKDLSREEYIRALESIVVDVLDGEDIGDIRGMTGLPDERCKQIREQAQEIITKVIEEDKKDKNVSPDALEDVKAFGRDEWVYCYEHLRPHLTGWCTVACSRKVGLGVHGRTQEAEKAAYAKVERLGLKIFGR